MGCFLACFGYTKKRKRPKCCIKIISSDQERGKYVPLNSELPHTHSLKTPPGCEKKEKTKDQSSLKVKKKVSFNLNVKTYELLNYANEIDNAHFSEGEDETKWELNEEETKRATMVGGHLQKDKAASYRYQNIQDFYDEEDEIMEEDSSLDDDDGIFVDEEGSDIDNSGDEEDGTIINDHQENEATMDNLMASHTLDREELSGEEPNQNVRNRSRYAYSVLNPVENLAQWKSIKAKDRLQRKRLKETVMSEKENQVPEETITKSSATPRLYSMRSSSQTVDASLSNWLITSKDELITKV